MTIIPNETLSTNYVYEAYMSMSNLVLETQEMLNDEYDLLTEAAESPMVKANSLISRKSLLGRLIEFIKKIVETFKGHANNFYKIYNKWLESAKTNLNDVNFQNMSITAYNSYFESEDKINDAKNFIFRVDGYNYKKLRSENMDEFIQKQPVNKYVDKEGSLANGCKNYFRYGEVNPRLTKVTISGDKLKMITSQCIDYCLSFGDVVKKISNLSKNFEDAMKIAENVINNKSESTQESMVYSYLEESFVNFNRIGLYNNIDIDIPDFVLEADEEKGTAPDIETGPQKSNVDGGKAGVETGDEGQEKQIRDLSNQDAKTLTFLCRYLQVVYASVLTVAEERYNSYIKICRYALSKTKFRYNPDGDNKNDIIDKSKVDKNTEYNNKNIRGKVASKVKDTFTFNK